ncbi:MAG TPA: hypothetical protein VIQ30_14815 [Pseudonocardia sp.]
MTALTCALTEHRPDGSTSVRVWLVDEDTSARIAVALGRPHTVQLLTPTQADAADALAEHVLTIHGDQHCAG